jgi:hypothetical protein
VKYWGLDAVSQIFILLTCCAAFDIFHDPRSGTGPEVFLIDVSDCFISFGVTVDGAFMPNVHQFTLYPLIWWYDKSSAFGVPPEWFIWAIYVLNWVNASPFVHQCVVAVLDYCDGVFD